MLVHIVLFWLKKELSAEDKKHFMAEVQKLSAIPDVSALYVGTPAKTAKRPVIDDSYDVCLTVIYKDLAAHDRYQTHELHHQFLKNNSSKWSKVLIYDAD